VAVDSSNNIYVSDLNHDRIQKFDDNGRFITKWGSQGIRDGQFKQPRGVDVDSSNNIYVVETAGNRVQKFVLHAVTIFEMISFKSITTTPGEPNPVTFTSVCFWF
jgi:DNA-binding beta-propeller fold protein YncE